jgi:glutaredoxin-related protein
MPRPVLEESRIHADIRSSVAGWHADTLDVVRKAAAEHPVLVVGMAQNPFCAKARKALAASGIAHHYLEYGSYFSQWRRRTALKMWTGWPTFPMVFVKGNLVGGAQDLDRLIGSGDLQRLLG